MFGLSNVGEAKTWNHDELIEASNIIIPELEKRVEFFNLKLE